VKNKVIMSKWDVLFKKSDFPCLSTVQKVQYIPICIPKLKPKPKPKPKPIIKELYKSRHKSGKICYDIKYIDEYEIDVHRVTKLTLLNYLKTNIKIIMKTKPYKIICGKGNHSENNPVLKDSIIQFCVSRNLKYKSDSKGGRIIINPQPTLL